MSIDRWTTSNKAVYNIGYHLIWCPKYRRKVLSGAVETRLRQILLERAKEIGITIETMEIMPDHVHLLVKSPTDLSSALHRATAQGYIVASTPPRVSAS